MNSLFLIMYAIGCIVTFLYFEHISKNIEKPDYNTMAIVSVAWPMYWIVWALTKIFV